jgi:hypothetical protein
VGALVSEDEQLSVLDMTGVPGAPYLMRGAPTGPPGRDEGLRRGLRGTRRGQDVVAHQRVAVTDEEPPVGNTEAAAS